MFTLSPMVAMSIAYIYIIFIILYFYGNNYYVDNTFFSWGPPVKFFHKQITSFSDFYFLQGVIFFHQLVNNWVNSVVYPWIINNIQDPKDKTLLYPSRTSLILINLFNIYSEFDVIFIVMGFSSQISFVFFIIAANIISSTIINIKHIKNKEEYTPI